MQRARWGTGAWRKRSGRRKEEGESDGQPQPPARLVKMMATDAEEISFPTSPCPVPDNSASSTLSIKITRKNQDRKWKLRFIYLQCCEYRHTTVTITTTTTTVNSTAKCSHVNIKRRKKVKLSLLTYLTVPCLEMRALVAE